MFLVYQEPAVEYYTITNTENTMILLDRATFQQHYSCPI